MRVTAQSRNVLTVETRSPSLLWLALPLALAHGAWIAWMFWPVTVFFHVHPFVGSLVAFIFVTAYGMFIRLCFGPLSDRITVTFSGAKAQLSVESLWFGKIKTENQFPFTEIEKFEISPPENRGFCRVQLADGRSRLLFRIGKTDDFSAIQRLEEIIRKKTEIVM